MVGNVDAPGLFFVGLFQKNLSSYGIGDQFAIGRQRILRSAVGEGLLFGGVKPFVGIDLYGQRLDLFGAGLHRIELHVFLEDNGAPVSRNTKVADGFIFIGSQFLGLSL